MVYGEEDVPFNFVLHLVKGWMSRHEVHAGRYISKAPNYFNPPVLAKVSSHPKEEGGREKKGWEPIREKGGKN